MQISEKDANRRFILEVSEDELRIIERVLHDAPGSFRSGDVTEYQVWDKLDDFFIDSGVSKLREDD